VDKERRTETADSVNLPQFNGHFKKYTEKWYTMQKKGVSDERKAAEIQPRV
jgi:hypothetical protein